MNVDNGFSTTEFPSKEAVKDRLARIEPRDGNHDDSYDNVISTLYDYQTNARYAEINNPYVEITHVVTSEGKQWQWRVKPGGDETNMDIGLDSMGVDVDNFLATNLQWIKHNLFSIARVIATEGKFPIHRLAFDPYASTPPIRMWEAWLQNLEDVLFKFSFKKSPASNSLLKHFFWGFEVDKTELIRLFLQLDLDVRTSITKLFGSNGLGWLDSNEVKQILGQ